MSDDKCAGSLGLNHHNQIVWAGDRVHVTRDKEYRCICDVKCGCVLILKRGKKLLKSGKPIAPHFAYPRSGKIIGCTGKIPTPEAIEHNEAKWLIHDKLSEFTFWDVCGEGHRVGSSHQYNTPEWTCTIEKKIPGTLKRIADVLLHNTYTNESVAIEVRNTHKVDLQKAQECKQANVRIIEVLASTVNSGVCVVNNQRVCDQWDQCQVCVQEEKRIDEMWARFEVQRKRDEVIRLEIGKRKREEEQVRKRGEQIKRKRDNEARERQEQVDREKTRVAELHRIEKLIETAEQDRIRQIEQAKLDQERERVQAESDRIRQIEQAKMDRERERVQAESDRIRQIEQAKMDLVHRQRVVNMRPELKKRMASFFVH
jgi:hypothetical protein